MIIITFLTILLMLFNGQTQAQNTFVKLLDAERIETASDLTQAQDGSIWTVGSSLDKNVQNASPYSDPSSLDLLSAYVCVQKMDANAKLIWSKTYEKLGEWSKGEAICSTKDGGIAIVGVYKAGIRTPEYPFLAKINKEGVLEWQYFYLEQTGKMHGVLEDKNGDLIAVGEIQGTASSTTAILTIKHRAKGNLLWTKVYGGESEQDIGYDIIENDGGYLIAGSFTGSSKDEPRFARNQKSFAVVQISKEGTFAWAKKYDEYRSEAFGLAADTNGDVLVVGRDARKTDSTGGAVVLKIDKKGALIWRKNLGKDRTDEANDLVVIKNNEYVVLAKIRENNIKYDGNSSIVLVRYAANGKVLSYEVCQRYVSDRPGGIIALNNGFFVSGTADVGGKNEKTLLLKADENGSGIWDEPEPDNDDVEELNSRGWAAHTDPDEKPIYKPRICGYDVTDIEEQQACMKRELEKYFEANLKYPEEAKTKGIEGIIVVDAFLSCYGVLQLIFPRNNIGGGCAAEAVRLVNAINDDLLVWYPAKHNGKFIATEVSFEVKFELKK